MTTLERTIEELLSVNVNELKTSQLAESIEELNAAILDFGTETAKIQKEYAWRKDRVFSLESHLGKDEKPSEELLQLKAERDEHANQVNERLHTAEALKERRRFLQDMVEHRRRCLEQRRRLLEQDQAELKEAVDEYKAQLKERIRKHKNAIVRLQA